MDKVIFSHDNDAVLQKAGGHLAFLFENTRHIKAAASSAFSDKLLRQHLPDDNHFGVHLIAMGASDNYGFNKNGDHWARHDLKARHDTFVKCGHFFVEHRNRDPKLAIGKVAASGYNEEMDRVELVVHGCKKKASEQHERAKRGEALAFSMSCFPAGTQVRMADGSDKALELVAVGDEVLTHKGSVGQVSHTMRRHYTGPGVELRAYGLPEPVRCTPDHGIWHRPKATHVKTCPVCGERFNNLKAHLWQKKDGKHKAAYLGIAKYVEGFTAAGNLLPGDLVRQPIDHRTNGRGEHNLAVVAGYYLSEGSLSVIDSYYTAKTGKRYGPYPDHRVEFTFHEAETALIEELQAAVVALGFSRPSDFHYPDEHRRVVRSHSKELHDWLLEHCGKYSWEKKLSLELMQWAPAMQKILLERWLAGDGTWHDFNEVLSGTTVSRRMAWQMLDISGRLGLAASLVKDDKPRKKKIRTAYVLSFRGDAAAALDCFKKPVDWQSSKGRTSLRPVGHLRHQQAGQTSVHSTVKALSFVEAGFIYRQIRTVKTVFLDEPVYDITVPGDHGFTANGHGVSNCRVPFDVCSCCENQAKSARFYCTHLASRMTQFVPEFQKFAFARNPQPTFFDISDVKNPADRIAWYLDYMLDKEQSKSASAEFPFSNLVAERIGVGLPAELGWSTLAGRAALEKLAANEDFTQSVLRGGLSDVDGRVHLVKEAMPFLFTGAEISDAQLATLRQVQPDVVFHYLNKQAAVLPFPTFFAMVNGLTLTEAEQSDVCKAAQQKLPTLFRDLQQQPADAELEQMFAPASLFKASCDCGPGDPVQSLLNQVSEKLSMQPEQVRVRVVRNCAAAPEQHKSASAVSGEFPAEVMEKAAVVSRAYATYKVAQLVHLTDHNLIDDPVVPLLFCQHKR